MCIQQYFKTLRNCLVSVGIICAEIFEDILPNALTVGYSQNFEWASDSKRWHHGRRIWFLGGCIWRTVYLLDFTVYACASWRRWILARSYYIAFLCWLFWAVRWKLNGYKIFSLRICREEWPLLSSAILVSETGLLFCSFGCFSL